MFRPGNDSSGSKVVLALLTEIVIFYIEVTRIDIKKLDFERFFSGFFL